MLGTPIYIVYSVGKLGTLAEPVLVAAIACDWGYVYHPIYPLDLVEKDQESGAIYDYELG